MRHYFSHDTQGNIIASHLWFGGFPPEAKLEDEDESQHHAVRSTMSHPNANLANRDGYVLYECPCPASQGHCNCAARARDAGRVVDGRIIMNPEAEVWLDGTRVVGSKEKPLVREPLSVISVVFKVPDGSAEDSDATVGALGGGGMATLSVELPKTVRVAGGQTPPVRLVVPSQGHKGGVFVRGSRIAPTRLYILGFVTA